MNIEHFVFERLSPDKLEYYVIIKHFNRIFTEVVSCRDIFFPYIKRRVKLTPRTLHETVLQKSNKDYVTDSNMERVSKIIFLLANLSLSYFMRKVLLNYQLLSVRYNKIARPILSASRRTKLKIKLILDPLKIFNFLIE